jgi:type VI secretion system protein ImpA
MISAEALLQPISAEKPCGEDLSYDPAFQELEVIMRGKEETQFSPAEEPDWKLLSERCLELLVRTKDLRIATTLALAAAKTEGFPGVRESLGLLKGLLEKYWDTVYPLLDPADNNDPTQRVNIIAALATPVGTFGDPMRFLERLREVPLVNSSQMGRFSLADILRSEAGEPGPEQEPPVQMAQIEAAFRSVSPEELTALGQALNDCISAVQGIDALLTTTIGADKAPDLDVLPKELKEMQKRLVPFLPAGTVPAEQSGEGTPAGAVVAAPISGEIQSRADVVRMLEKVCDYFKREEPSSPVPLLLKRAQRWTEMDFMQVIDDLAPEALKEIQRVTGEKAKEGE